MHFPAPVIIYKVGHNDIDKIFLQSSNRTQLFAGVLSFYAVFYIGYSTHMVIPLSIWFKIEPKALEELGVLNAFIGIDNRVFVDPNLLRKTEIPEFKNARKELEDYFAPIITLIKACKAADDVAWREAKKRLQFKEEHGAALGYSGAETSGRGVGPLMAGMLVERGKEIVNLGIEAPEMFELIGLFQEDFGPDLLSDMAVAILKESFFAYTQRVTSTLGLNPSKDFKFNKTNWLLPVHPDGKKALILVPAELLTPLPVALDRSEIDLVAEFNAEVRTQWNKIIAVASKDDREPSKAEIRELLLAAPKNLSDLIDVYRKAAGIGYDFKNDPKGLLSWDYIGRMAAQSFPLTIEQKKPKSVEEMRQILDLIIGQFKKNIEENKLYEMLYGENGKARDEVFSQRLFYANADSYCAANDVDLTREPNAGNGPVDFKLSHGYHGRILVEVKKSSNPHLLHGFETQLAAYQKSEATEEALYLIMRVTEGETGINDVINFRREKLKAGLKVPDIVIIDARKRPSASKR